MGIYFRMEVCELIPDQEGPAIEAHTFFSICEKETPLSLQMKAVRRNVPPHYLDGASLRPIRGGYLRPSDLRTLDYKSCGRELTDVFTMVSRWPDEEFAVFVMFDDEIPKN